MESTRAPPAVIGIGKNYLEHARETGLDVIPEFPVIFFKNPSALCKDGEAIVIPKICQHQGPQVDYEGELAVIIGKDCKNVSKEDALSVVDAYAVANDVSARWWQRSGSGG
jgi:2-keto-4-pentenoate hydratase/2-oxohepta-3-ene-1,7-dioic acid hydratase in catechol pathway